MPRRPSPASPCLLRVTPSRQSPTQAASGVPEIDKESTRNAIRVASKKNHIAHYKARNLQTSATVGKMQAMRWLEITLESERSYCKDCQGRGICKHQRRRSRCKECGGATMCPHQREKSRCKQCGGAGICPRQRRSRAPEAARSCPSGMAAKRPETDLPDPRHPNPGGSAAERLDGWRPSAARAKGGVDSQALRRSAEAARGV